MRSRLVKVLQPLVGLPIIVHLVELCRRVGVKRTIIVVGHQADRVKQALAELANGVEFVLQGEQRGTAHAVLQAEEALRGTSGEVLVLSGDTPLLTRALVERLLDAHLRTGAQVTSVTARLEDPTRYGRVIRDAAGNFLRVIEEVEATDEQRTVQEINAGVYCFSGPPLFRALHQVRPSRVKRELYLPEVLHIIQQEGGMVGLFVTPDPREVLGINTREELANAHAVLWRRAAIRWMDEGVTILEPETTHISPLATIGLDTILYPNVYLEGRTTIGEDCVIYPGCRIRNSHLGNRVTVLDGCVILDSEIADECTLGPSAHLRPRTRLMRKVKVGNFVEAKKSVICADLKVPPLTYVGDATHGDRVNVGAETITCKYDSFAKHPTIIE